MLSSLYLCSRKHLRQFSRSLQLRYSHYYCSLQATCLYIGLIQLLLHVVWFILYFNSLSKQLTNVLEEECLCSRFLENSIVTTLLFVYCVHIVVSAFVYLSMSCSVMLVVVGLLGTSWMYLLVWLVHLNCCYFRNNLWMK